MNSPYPVILSLDVHADQEGQEKMANVMIKIFGDQLFMPDEHMTRWPSPNQLKFKIILKNKKIPMNHNKNNTTTTTTTMNSSRVVSSPPLVPPTTTTTILFDDSLVFGEDETEDSNDEDEDFSSDNSSNRLNLVVMHDQARVKTKRVKVAQKLSDITALGTTKLTNFQDPSIWSLPCWKMFSLSEKKVEKLLNQEPMNLIKFNQNHFSRSYPHGLRFDSSNYDPTSSFVMGVHMSALNTQTHCAFYRMNEFKFKENANSGYVLKPKILRAGSEESFPDEKSHVKQYISK